MQNKVNELEKSMIEVKTIVGGLAKDMAVSTKHITAMSKAITKMAVMDTKIEVINADITNVASMCRTNKQEIDSVVKEIHSKSEHHFEQCSTISPYFLITYIIIIIFCCFFLRFATYYCNTCNNHNC